MPRCRIVDALIAVTKARRSRETILICLSVFRRWFHGGRQVFPSAAAAGRVVMSSGSVLLRNVTEAEWGGEWRCRVENQLGSKEVTINLVVYGKFKMKFSF